MLTQRIFLIYCLNPPNVWWFKPSSINTLSNLRQPIKIRHGLTYMDKFINKWWNTKLTMVWDTKQRHPYNMTNKNTTTITLYIWQYKNTSMTQLSTSRPILNAQALELWVEKPCDPPQDMYHPKHNSLYVVLQEGNTWNYRLPYNICDVVVIRVDPI